MVASHFYSFVNPSYSTLTAVLTVLMDTQTHGLANNALSPTDHSCFAIKTENSNWKKENINLSFEHLDF